MMRFSFRYIVFLVLTLLIAGCSAKGSDFRPVAAAPGNGVVHIYRTSSFWGYGDAPHVKIDGRKIGTLKNAGFLTAQLAPGTHVIEVRVPLMQWFGGRKAKVSVKPGGKYYFKVASRIDNIAYSPSGPIPTSSFHIQPVSQSRALSEIGQTKSSE